jgi:hypothetical protein
MRGTPGAEALIDIPGLAHGVKLKEQSPGQYTRSLTVSSQTPVSLDRAPVIGRLRDGDGVSPPAASNGALRIDSTPPVIEGLFPKPDAQVVRLRTPILAQVTDQNGSGLAAERSRLIIDQEDMSDSIVATPDYLTYLPAVELAPGDHTAHLMVYDRAGNMKSQSWHFTIIDSGGTIHAITSNADRITAPGDILSVTVEGMWGASVKLLVGHAIEIPMKEQSPGFYEATHAVTPADLLAGVPLAVRFAVPELKPVTETLERSIGPSLAPLPPPAVTDPPEAKWPMDPPIIKGKAAPRSRIRLRVEYSASISGTDVSGVLSDQVVRVPISGKWTLRLGSPSAILTAAAPRYRITVETLAPYSADPDDPPLNT